MQKKFLMAVIVFAALFTAACTKYSIDTTPAAGLTPTPTSITAAPFPLPAFWRTKANYPGGGRYHAFSFTLSGKGYVGAGDNGDFLFPKVDFWSFDPTHNVWTQKANAPGGERVAAAAFAISNKGYITTGFTLSDTHLHFGNKSDTWMYDPVTNTWTAKAAFPGGARGGAVGMTLNSKGYVGTGAFHDNTLMGPDTMYRDWWEFDPVTNTWTRKADFPGAARCYAAGASGYMGSGCNYTFLSGTNYGDWYRYTASTDTWTLLSSKAFAVRNSAVAVAAGKKIYFGTGTTGDPLSGGLATAKNDMARFDPLTNTWTVITSLPATRSGAAAFTISDTIYVGTGFSPEFRALTVN